MVSSHRLPGTDGEVHAGPETAGEEKPKLAGQRQTRPLQPAGRHGEQSCQSKRREELRSQITVIVVVSLQEQAEERSWRRWPWLSCPRDAAALLPEEKQLSDG